MTSVIIIDEVSQDDKLIYECLDRSLCDIKVNKFLFGGVFVRFVLPVVKRGSRAQIVHLEVCDGVESKEKERVRKFSDATFAAYLSDIDSGQILHSKRHLFPKYTKFVFNDLDENYKIASWLCSRAVITSTNEVVNSMNEHMIRNLLGESREYCSSGYNK
uniref:ATP-dependent DNA helicase n=1 Tax=Octopus bimaculoides TaxID=37653 RepID=A0A0L8I4Q7_OCTBM